MNLSIAIVGLPNVGKSTLFNALLKQQVALAANYPFATIEPNVGIAQVPDPRLAQLAKLVGASVIKPATVEFVDVAGLVKGAAEGAGLGNQFLSHIRETSAICHVLRAFANDDIIREGAVSPAEDLVTIRTELQLADLATLEKQQQPKGSVNAEDVERWQAVLHLRELVSSGVYLSQHRLTEVELQICKELCLLSSKPEVFALNVDEDQLTHHASLVARYASMLDAKPDAIVIVSAQIESELSVLGEADYQAYLAEWGLKQSGLERLAEVAYQTLGLQSFLTAGEKEVRAWTIARGTTAPEAAGVIHTDFIRHFIKALVVSYPDFVAAGGWKAARETGKLRQEGRDYVMGDQDVVEFMIGK